MTTVQVNRYPEHTYTEQTDGDHVALVPFDAVIKEGMVGSKSRR